MMGVKKGCYAMVIAVSMVWLLGGCSGGYKSTPRNEMFAYQNRPTYGSLYALAVAHAERLNASLAEDTLHPGLYAEYGIALAMMGHKGVACRMLNAEVAAFPESRGMVRRIKERLMPDMLADTLAGVRDSANLLQLAEWAYDSVRALQPLPYIPSVIDSTDTAWIAIQTPVDSVTGPVRLTANQKRELLEQQQQADKLRQQFVRDSIAAAKQAVQDSIAAVKQAKIDAREAAKKQRKIAQKEKEKARADARKERQKQAKKRSQKKNK